MENLFRLHSDFVTTHHKCEDTPLDTFPLETALDILQELTRCSVDASYTKNISCQDLTEIRGL